MKVQITYPDSEVRQFECEQMDTSCGTIILYDSKDPNIDCFYTVKDWSECEVLEDGA